MSRLPAVFIGVLLSVLQVISDGSGSRIPVTNSSGTQYQVLISELDTNPVCNGVAVAKGIILTSASCVLQFGSIHSFLEESVLYGGGTRLLFDIGSTREVTVHPQYSENPVSYDMALVKFNPEDKGPYLAPVVIRETWGNGPSPVCVMTSWWASEDSWPETLMQQAVSLTRCSVQEPGLICFNSTTVEINKKDLGSPIVCNNELVGLIPQGSNSKAINLTYNYKWLSDQISLLTINRTSDNSTQREDIKSYLIKILQKLDILAENKSPNTFNSNQNYFTSWNDQIVIPLSYLLLSVVIFFSVIFLFIVVISVVLIYYCRKK